MVTDRWSMVKMVAVGSTAVIRGFGNAPLLLSPSLSLSLNLSLSVFVSTLTLSRDSRSPRAFQTYRAPKTKELVGSRVLSIKPGASVSAAAGLRHFVDTLGAQLRGRQHARLLLPCALKTHRPNNRRAHFFARHFPCGKHLLHRLAVAAILRRTCNKSRLLVDCEDGGWTWQAGSTSCCVTDTRNNDLEKSPPYSRRRLFSCGTAPLQPPATYSIQLIISHIGVFP